MFDLIDITGGDAEFFGELGLGEAAVLTQLTQAGTDEHAG